MCAIFSLLALGCADPDGIAAVIAEEGGTGPFTLKVADTVSQVATGMGWDEPFIVITKIGGDVITADTPTPLKANTGAIITLQVTIPDTYTVTGLKANSVTPQRASADGAAPAEYTFKMPQAATTVSGALTPKTQEDLVKIESVFDNTLQELSIAQGVISPVDSIGVASILNYIRPFRNDGGDGGGEGNGEEEEAAEPQSLFDPDKTAYTASVPFSGYPAVITAIPSDSEAFVKVSPTEPNGENKFTVTIEVTSSFWHLYPNYKKAEGDGAWVDGDKSKTYTIEVTREAGSTDASLSSISVMQTELTSSGDGMYAGTVASNVDKLNINATAAHHNARVQVTSGGATYPANLTDAENSISKEVAAPGAGASGDITVKATAEDGITSKAYTVTIYRAEHSEGEPVFMAEGGVASIKNIGGQDYEIHTFTVDSATSLGGQTLSELEFTTLPAGGTVAVLVVAGGGAGGKSEGGISRSGGGGAGGFIYHPEYNLGNKKTFDVKVGAGGAKSSIVNIAANDTRGGNGGDSAFGTEFTAKGGGGGGNHTGYYWADGADGGSGGGSGNRQGGAAIPGTAPTGALNLGNKGGTTQTYGYSGGGGGGAKTAGKDINVVRSGGDGGAGTLSAISGTLSWYAGGGAGGAEDKYNAGEQYGAKAGNSGEAGTGDGGSGGGGVSSVDNGGNGGSGIVIVRWPVVSAD